MTLRIGTSGGKAFTLPPEAVTQTFGILAKRGVGKTYTGSVLAEELIRAGHQVVVLDPLDAWWGLRSSADGKAPGLPIYVFGGGHGDLPLDAAAGALLADVVVEQGISVVLSMRHLSKRAQRDLVATFAERLYHRKGEDQYRTPLHFIIDEADAFAPQRVMAEQARMLGAIDDCVRRGRSSGIGVTLITQRSASLNKDVLTQCEVLIALRTIAPQDRKAIDEWIAAHDSEGHRAELMASLASLDIGEAWIWSPGWLDVFERVQIRTRRTFDSSATPKAGAKPVVPKTRAPVDLDALRERMASVVKEQEANDPKKLRAENARLARELAQARKKGADNIAQVSTCNHEREIAQFESIIDTKEREIVGVRQLHTEAESELASVYAANDIIAAELVTQAKNLRHRADVKKRKAVPASTVPIFQPQPRPKDGNHEGVTPARAVTQTGQFAELRKSTPAPNGAAPSGDLSAIGQRILNAIAWWEAIGVEAPTKQNAGHVAGYRVGKSVGGNFGKALGALRSRDLIDYPNGRVALTSTGRALAEPPEAIPSLEALHDAIRENLDGPEQRVLNVVIDAHPAALSKQETGARAGYTVGPSVGGNFGKLLGHLRSLGLIDYASGNIVATALLFPEGLA